MMRHHTQLDEENEHGDLQHPHEGEFVGQEQQQRYGRILVSTLRCQ